MDLVTAGTAVTEGEKLTHHVSARGVRHESTEDDTAVGIVVREPAG